MLDPLIAQHLTGDGAPDRWDVATTSLLAEAAASAARTRDEAGSV